MNQKPFQQALSLLSRSDLMLYTSDMRQ